MERIGGHLDGEFVADDRLAGDGGGHGADDDRAKVAHGEAGRITSMAKMVPAMGALEGGGDTMVSATGRRAITRSSEKRSSGPVEPSAEPGLDDGSLTPGPRTAGADGERRGEHLDRPRASGCARRGWRWLP